MTFLSRASYQACCAFCTASTGYVTAIDRYGDVLNATGGWAEVEVKNKFSVGDQIQVIHPSGNHVIELKEMQKMDGEPVQVAPGSPLHVRIPLPEQYNGALLARLIPAEEA